MPNFSALRFLAENCLSEELALMYLELVDACSRLGPLRLRDIEELAAERGLIEVEDLMLSLVGLDMLLEVGSNNLLNQLNAPSLSSKSRYAPPLFAHHAINTELDCRGLEGLSRSLGFVEGFREMGVEDPARRGLLALMVALRARGGYVSASSIKAVALQMGYGDHVVGELIAELKGLGVLIPVVEATGALKLFVDGSPPYYRVPRFLALGLKELVHVPLGKLLSRI